MTSWMTPLAFLLFFPLLVAVAWRFWRRERQQPSLQYASLSIVKKLAPSWRMRLRWLPLTLYLCALGLGVFALARPQRADVRVRKNVEGIDIMIVLDVSDSMLIEDMNPNRLEACKEVIKQFIKGRSSDRIGLVIFSGESYTRVPLTLDYPMLLQSLEQVKISRSIKMGTAIGVALANGAARLKDSTAKSRVMVFLTDGENNSGTIDPETALDIAKGYGLKIYSIGAGVDGDAQLPVESVDAFGRKVKRYQPIHSTVNDALLSKMAQDTGGKYYRATDNKTLQNVFRDIDNLEKTKVDVNQYTKYAELYRGWLGPAILLFVLAQIMSIFVLRRGP